MKRQAPIPESLRCLMKLCNEPCLLDVSQKIQKTIVKGII